MITEFTAASFARGRVVPDHVRYVTYTLRYNHDYWVTVDGFERQFYRAYVDATRDSAKANFTITTTNISRLILDDSPQRGKSPLTATPLTTTPSPGTSWPVQRRSPQTFYS